jgi:hypothetical protein
VPRQAVAAHGRIAISAALAAPRFTGRDQPLAALAAALGARLRWYWLRGKRGSARPG